MSKRLQLRRGTTDEHSAFTGARGEPTVDTDKNTLVIHDGATVGGFPLAKVSNLTKDTGWVNLTSYLVNDWVAHSSYYKPMYRKIGKIVFLRGLISDGTGVMQFENLPSEIRPSIHLDTIFSSAGTKKPVVGRILSETHPSLTIEDRDNTDNVPTSYVSITCSYIAYN